MVERTELTPAILEAILDNEDESAGSSGTPLKRKPTPADRVRGLADRLMGADKIDSVLAGDAARADGCPLLPSPLPPASEDSTIPR